MYIPQKIKDRCPSCEPYRVVDTTCTFINEIDKKTNELLYKCDNCGAKMWVFADAWLKTQEIMQEVYTTLDDFAS